MKPPNARRERRDELRVQPAAERQRAADHVLPETALALVQAGRAARGERGALERRADAALVEPVADLVHAAEQRLEVVLVVPRRHPDIGRRERGAERMHGAVEAERQVVVAEGGHDGDSDRLLAVLRERACTEVDARIGRRGDQGNELFLEAGEDGADFLRRRPGLVIVEEHVVRVARRVEAGDVLALQLEMPVEPRAERGVVVVGPRDDPRLHALRGRLRQLGGEVGGNAARLVPVTPRDPDQARVVRVIGE